MQRQNDEAAEGTYQYLLRAGFQASTPPSTFSAGVGSPASVPEPLLTLPAPVSSSPAFLVAAAAPPDYTPVGVTRMEETGARGETLWARNDLLESSMPGGLPKN